MSSGKVKLQEFELITLTRPWVSLSSGHIMANLEPPKLLGYFREAALRHFHLFLKAI